MSIDAEILRLFQLLTPEKQDAALRLFALLVGNRKAREAARA